MNSVKRDHPHVPELMGGLLLRVRAAFGDEDWDGLRQSHFRLLTSVPDQDIAITELAERLSMTKQGCGQFVAALADSGYLHVDIDTADRRVRVVRRTAAGTRMVQRVDARVGALEEQWAAEVGPRRYATFRRVLAEIAYPDDRE